MPEPVPKDIPLWVAFNPQKEVGLQAILNTAWEEE
jgi:hypothetical protein